MLIVLSPHELLQHIGDELGPSEWITVDQPMIDKFAEATGDHQWIHVDVERARRELPDGKTIAHGFLTLALLPKMEPMLLQVKKHSRALNYGSNSVRYTNRVPVGSQIRLRQTLKHVEETKGNGVRITSTMVVEIKGQERPALIAETIAIIYA